MTFYDSLLETRLRDETDLLSPYGDISWNAHKVEGTPEYEREESELEELGSRDRTGFSDFKSKKCYFYFRSSIDIDSSSIRESILHAYLSILMRETSRFALSESQISLKDWSTETTGNRRDKEISEEIVSLFSLANHIALEPGYPNAFSEGLELVIAEHGVPALMAIQKLILGDQVKSSIGMEALQYVGDAESGTWLNARRKMLEECLRESDSAWIRDGAGLGIASLNDVRSIGAVKEAIRKEPSDALKEDLNLVLHQLQNISLD